MRIHDWLLASLCCAAYCTVGLAEDSKQPSPDAVLADFAKNWDEALWRPKRFRGGYMRPLDDRGWQARMAALQKLVQQGKAAVPALVKALRSEKAPERILAAQALGYLAPHAPIDALLDAAMNDRDAAVRLYAVDSLGMQGEAAKSVDWQSLLSKERNRDVKMHIKYAQERKGKTVEADVVSALTKWDAKTLNSAVIGKPAPDFAQQSAQGKTVKLADFKGKQAVVLVFIYGDT